MRVLPLLTAAFHPRLRRFGGVSTHGVSFIRGMLQPHLKERFLIEEALRHPWLQPVHDEKLRQEFMAQVPEAVLERRRSRAARRRLRVSALKIMAIRRRAG